MEVEAVIRSNCSRRRLISGERKVVVKAQTSQNVKGKLRWGAMRRKEEVGRMRERGKKGGCSWEWVKIRSTGGAVGAKGCEWMEAEGVTGERGRGGGGRVWESRAGSLTLKRKQQLWRSWGIWAAPLYTLFGGEL